jgi:ADP-ribose pyrophosphatase YjhB (NUDIX family)
VHPIDLFRYCPRCGAARGKDNLGVSPLRCSHCSLAYFFNPTVAAAAFVYDDADRVLFIRREKEPSKGMLAIPGGFIDFGESAEDGLRREVREEVGIELECVQFLASFPNLYPYAEVDYPVVDLYFTAIATNPGDSRPLDAVLGIEWRLSREVPDDEIAFASLRAALGMLKLQSG